VEWRHRSCYFTFMALVIVFWVGLSVIGCLALLRAATRRTNSATESASPETPVYTVNSEPAREPAFVRQSESEPALSSQSI
jgi:hypothetical protein